MIQIVAPERRRAEELYELAAKVFGNGGYFRFLRACRGGYFAGSSYDWSVSRVAEEDGRMVSHVGIWDYQMRVGRARLRTGGVGAVMTHGDYRKRGLACRVFGALLPAMREAGYHFSLLFGIRNFYDRFGYVPAWPTQSHVVGLDALPDEPLKLKLRRMPRREVLCGKGAIMRIYNLDNARRTGTAERPLYTRTRGLVGGFDLRALCDSAGRVRGYVVVQAKGEEMQVQEVGGLDRPCGPGQLLAAIKRLARRAKCRRVRFVSFGYDHPICQVLRAGDCSVEMRHSRSGGPMARVVSLGGCLERMCEELTERLRASTMKGFKGTLGIRGAGEAAALSIANGRVRLAPRPTKTPHRIVAGPAVARLIIGSADPATLAAQSQVRFTGAAAELAEALFPKQWPMLNQLDHF